MLRAQTEYSVKLVGSVSLSCPMSKTHLCGNGPCSQMGHKTTHLPSSPGAGLSFGQGHVSRLNTCQWPLEPVPQGCSEIDQKLKWPPSPSEQPRLPQPGRKACINGETLRPHATAPAHPWWWGEKAEKWELNPPTPSPSLHSAISCSAIGNKPLPLFGAQPVPMIPRVLQGWGRTSTRVTRPSPGPSCLQRVGSPLTVKTEVKQLWNHQEISGKTKVTNRPN